MSARDFNPFPFPDPPPTSLANGMDGAGDHLAPDLDQEQPNRLRSPSLQSLSSLESSTNSLKKPLFSVKGIAAGLEQYVERRRSLLDVIKDLHNLGQVT